MTRSRQIIRRWRRLKKECAIAELKREQNVDIETDAHEFNAKSDNDNISQRAEPAAAMAA